MYQVLDRSGQTFGPAPVDVLRQWAFEHRLTPDLIVIDTATGQQGLAGDMLRGMGVFIDPLPPDPDPAVVQPVGYTYQGSTAPGQPPMLQTRAVAFFIDFLIGMLVYQTLHGLFEMLFVRFQTSGWGILDYLDYLFIPASALYFLFRDAFFPGQSIGKRIAGLKVVTATGNPPAPLASVKRNLWATPILFLAMPGLGYLALALILLAFPIDSFLVLTQGKRFGDTLAGTTVVNS
ncbi:MAG TPA: RDD family protein [Fimbriimonadaceae bacterium]|nr:RDD family protein [Fimbriimonadaceae bacterium]